MKFITTLKAWLNENFGTPELPPPPKKITRSARKGIHSYMIDEMKKTQEKARSYQTEAA